MGFGDGDFSVVRALASRARCHIPSAKHPGTLRVRRPARLAGFAFRGRYLAQHRRGETRFAAVLFCLVAGTIGVTAFLFAIDYRAFYAQWHAATGSRTWLFQALFTSLSAIYQFMVLGIRLYLPLGGVALVLASLWLARAGGRQQR